MRVNYSGSSQGDTLSVSDGDLTADLTVGAVAENYLMSYIFMTPSLYRRAFGLTCLFSLLVNGIMYFSVKKIDMIESLKSVE